MTLDTSFPKGKALADFMEVNYPGSGGKVAADYVFNNYISIDPTKAQQWAKSESSSSGGAPGGPFPGTPATGPFEPRVYTVNMPVNVPADAQCGKGVHIDTHISNPGSPGTDPITASFPAGCVSPLKPAESLLAFFFFDLASCIQKENEKPKPPPVH
jgi:hypothetical protein